MATSYPGAAQVGSYFVGQYYQVLQQNPDYVHQFYTESSTMVRVDGDSSETASAMLQIHNLILSLNFTAIEIKTINSIDSWNGGVLVMVSGSVKTKDFIARRKFVQTFFLAPQEKGFFVLNDIFHFLEDEVVYQPPPAPVASESKFDNQLDVASPHPEPPASNYALEEEAREYVDSVHLEDDPVDKYSLPEEQHYNVSEQQHYNLQDQHYSVPEQQQQHDYEEETVVEEAPAEEVSVPIENVVNTVYDPPATVVEEPVGEPPKKTYASILRVARGQTAPSVTTQSSSQKSAPSYSEWDYQPQQSTTQHSNVGLSSVPESGADTTEESYSFEEGELKSVYVRNLPSTVTAAEIEQEFMNFGRIRPDGVFIRFRKEIGACYAFVEFEDLVGVQNAIQASPIQLAGRQIYIEERRANSSGASRGGSGGRRGRGRGSYQTDAPRGRFAGRGSSRGSNQDGGGDYNSTRGNGYYQRVSR